MGSILIFILDYKAIRINQKQVIKKGHPLIFKAGSFLSSGELDCRSHLILMESCDERQKSICTHVFVSLRSFFRDVNEVCYNEVQILNKQTAQVI